MKTEVIDGNCLTPEKYEYIGAALRSGALAAFPTDTVYGLGAVYSNEAAVKKIFAAKGRDEGKPLCVLVGSPDQAELLAESIPPEARLLMERFWPGPLTLILKKKEDVSDAVTAGGATIGLRMPDNRIALNIIKAAGAPLAAPSANTAGKRSAACIGDVLEDLGGRIELAVDGGLSGSGVSSTIIDVGNMKILRRGTITEEDLLQSISLHSRP